jgi:undecaprenyl-diphosphatase
MIIASSVMGIAHDPFVKLFTVSIQFGAILSVVFLYHKRFFQSWDFYFKLFVAFIPAAIFGFAFSDYIDQLLEDVVVVAVTLLLGGILFLFIDKIFNANEKQPDRPITYRESFVTGCFQVIAMIPGVSRSAATIIGGLSQKFNKKQAAEFSFFLAVPTMFAATAKTLLDHYKAGTLEINSHTLSIFAFGNVVAFIVAALAIKSFIGYLTKHGFKVFGYYRIILGAAILILYFMGIELTIV